METTASTFSATVFPSLYQSQGSETRLDASTFTRPEVVSLKSDATMWSPAVFEGQTRLKSKILCVFAIVVDIDELLIPVEELLLRAERIGYCFAHTTWSSRPDALKLRLVFPLSEGATSDQYLRAWDDVVKALDIFVDKTSREPSRAYFNPSASEGRENEFQFWERGTHRLYLGSKNKTVQTWLEKLRTAPDGARYDMVRDFAFAFSKERGAHAYAEATEEWPHVADALVAAGSVNVANHEKRWHESVEYALKEQEVDKRIAATLEKDRAETQQKCGLDAFSLLKTISSGTPEYDLYRLGQLLRRGGVTLDAALPSDLSAQQIEVIRQGFDTFVNTTQNWKAKLDCTFKKDAMHFMCTSANVARVLRMHPDLQELFFLDVRGGNVPMLRHNPPWSTGRAAYTKYPRPLQPYDDQEFLLWLADQGLTVGAAGARVVGSELTSWAADAPPVDWFSEWVRDIPAAYEEGSQLEELFIRGFSVADNVFHREIAVRTLGKAIWKAWYPGSKDDAMLMLAGPEDLGKTMLWSTLFHGCKAAGVEDWVMGVSLSEDKDAYAKLSRCVFGLDDEYRNSTRERAAHKNFISNQAPVVRLAYRENATKLARRAVLVSTTNEQHVIDDSTGARRYQVLHVKNKLNFAWVEKNVLYLWAQARAWAHRSKGRFDLSPEAAEIAKGAVAELSVNNIGMGLGGYADTLSIVVDTPISPNNSMWRAPLPNGRLQICDFFLRPDEVFIHILENQLDADRKLLFLTLQQAALVLRVDGNDRKVQTHIGIAFRRLGWGRRKLGNIFVYAKGE